MATRTATQSTVPCPKCDNSSGYIRAFSGIANGVCFTCAGSGVVKASRVKPPKPRTPYQEKIVAYITSGNMSILTYGQLKKLRDDALWPIPQHPELPAIWRERGEPYFQAAQQERLDASYR